MKDLFVPYKIALQLKELGFDEPCFGIWIGRGSKYDVMYVAKQEDAWMAEQNDGILAPIFAQAFEFIREKYNLLGCSQYFKGGYYCYTINDMKDTKESNRLFTEFSTFKEAEIACLEKLIEILKKEII